MCVFATFRLDPISSGAVSTHSLEAGDVRNKACCCFFSVKTQLNLERPAIATRLSRCETTQDTVEFCYSSLVNYKHVR